MTTHRLSFSLLLCLALLSSPVLAETSLWQVRDGDRVMYLGGTVHVLAAAEIGRAHV